MTSVPRPPTFHDLREADLEALLLDEDGIERIEGRLGGFNIFEAVGHTRLEQRHSAFLAFLLDPNGNHGLGTEFISRFAVEAVKALEPRPLSLGKIALMDLDGCLVLRERHHIDILCIDEQQKFLLAIENKIGISEHSNQLRKYRSVLEVRYPGFKRILVYLTPDKEQPSDDAYAIVGYRDVLGIVERLVEKNERRLNDIVTSVLLHYAQMLRRNIVADDELVEIARDIYRKHKMALDFIFEQRQDIQAEISERVGDVVREDRRVEVVRRVKSYINFFPKDWIGIRAFNATPSDKWTRTKHSLLFEIRNFPNYVRLAIVIGPSDDEDMRRRIMKFSNSRPDLFPGAKKVLQSQFTQIYSRSLVERSTLEKQSTDEVLDSLETEFQTFMEKEFSSIVGALAQAFQEEEVQ